ncbi:MAG: GNAT family N-acetyltransferase [Pseudomonadota bacterium]
MIHYHERGCAHIARDILEALPQWFGNAEARETYIREVTDFPMVVMMSEDRPLGFLSLATHSKEHREVYVMAVRPEFRRQGHGAALMDAAIEACKRDGACRLIVKTLSSRAPDPFYAETRAFYTAMGFRFQEDRPLLWNPAAPCAIYALELDEKRHPLIGAPR